MEMTSRAAPGRHPGENSLPAHRRAGGEGRGLLGGDVGHPAVGRERTVAQRDDDPATRPGESGPTDTAVAGGRTPASPRGPVG